VKGNDEDLRQATRKWNEGVASVGEIADLAREIGKQKLQEGIPVLIDHS
jgi:hypothetical protein